MGRECGADKWRVSTGGKGMRDRGGIGAGPVGLGRE